MTALAPFPTVTSRREQAFVESKQETVQLRNTVEFLTERMAELELAVEDRNWQKLTAESNREFSRQGLRIIAGLSRIFYLKNPLTRRAVSVKSMYVWGQGVNISATEDDINTVVTDFTSDFDNRRELFGHQARIDKEVDLEVNGNIFFVLFPHELTGKVKLSSIPFDEIEDIKTNPNNRKEPWYYVRQWVSAHFDVTTGIDKPVTVKEYYPDWHYNPKDKPEKIGGCVVHWESPVYHIKVGGLGDMRFGVPETYAGLDWARAYREFLEDWATLTRAHSRVAWNLTTKQGQAGIAAAKAKISTTVATGGTSFETNPPQVAGSTFISTGDKLEPMKTAGSKVSMEDGRRIGLMVCSAHGLPETMLFGDVSKGAHATAKTLDRPTELMMKERQGMWTDFIKDMLDYVIDWAIIAPQGKIKGKAKTLYLVSGGADLVGMTDLISEEIDRHIDVDFPAILQQDTKELVDAIVAATTLGGNLPNGAFPDKKFVARLFLTVLGQDDVDETLDQWFPEGSDTTWGDMACSHTTPDATPIEKAFKEALENFIGKLGSLAGSSEAIEKIAS